MPEPWVIEEMKKRQREKQKREQVAQLPLPAPQPEISRDIPTTEPSWDTWY